jgi:gamma-glutamylcyclotransferase (GGCT)/AIG2-like uncharacterized protein YtfP
VTELVLVYGSLKRGFLNGDVLERAVLIDATATTRNPNYEMVSFGLYPGVRPDGQWKIQGELYEIDRVLRDRLDEIENHPHGYCRELVAVDGTPSPAWIYLIPHSMAGAVFDDPQVIDDRPARTKRWVERI